MFLPFKHKPKQLPSMPKGTLASMRATTDDELIWAADYTAENGDTVDDVIRTLVTEERGYREEVPNEKSLVC